MRAVALGIPLATVLVTACAARFAGDGTFEDRGRGTAEDRYQIRLVPAIALDRSGAYRFAFSGMPGAEMTLGFRPARPATEAEVRARVTILKGEIAESGADAAEPLCRFELDTATATLTVAGRDDATVLWTEPCRALRFKRQARYTLVLTVSASQDTTPPLDVIASFDGGGWK